MDFFHDSLKFFEPYLTHYGYAAIFLVIFIESFGVPAPGQTLLIAAGLLAVHGKLNITLVLLTAFLAAVTGDSCGYWIGYLGGHRLILRFGKYVHVGEPQVRRMEAAFKKYGGWFVTFARFFEVLRQVNGIVAGAAAMPFRRFLLFNATGALLWAGVWGLAPLPPRPASAKVCRLLRYRQSVFHRGAHHPAGSTAAVYPQAPLARPHLVRSAQVMETGKLTLTGIIAARRS